MKKILYIGGFELPDKGAAAIRVMNNARLLKDIGYEVALLGVHKTEQRQDVVDSYNGFQYRTFHYPTSLTGWLRYLVNFTDFKEVERYKPDLVVLYDLPGLAILKWKRYCHSRGIKVIGDVTEWYLPKGGFIRRRLTASDTAIRMKYAHKKLDGMITISRFLYNYYSDNKCVMIPPLMDATAYNMNDVRPNNLTLVYAGNGGKNKDRLDNVIEAINNLYHPNLVFKIIGLTKEDFEGMYELRVEDKWNCIKFMGRLSHDETVNEIKNSHFQIFVRHPNRVATAGFPSKLPESFAIGVPVITNKTSNIAEFLHTGENGFLLETESPTEISEVLNYLLKMSKEEITEMIKRTKADLQFDYHTYEQPMQAFLNEVLDN